MKRRPVCLVCLLLMAILYVLDLTGVPIVSGNPLPGDVQGYIEHHANAVICGEVQQCRDTDYSLSIYLKQVYLTVQSEQIPIKNIKIYLESKENIKIGTILRVSGKLTEIPAPTNPGEFDSKQYYACQKIYYQMKNAKVLAKSETYSHYGELIQKLKNKIMNILSKASGDDEGVFEAMLLGEKENLDQELKIRYQMAGMIHILAISGLHISAFGMGVFKLLKKMRFHNSIAGLIALVILLQYGMLTGGSVSAMRAICMFVLAVGAKIIGRTYDMMTAMSLSAIILLLDSPAYLYSAGFLLSFGAVVGLGTVAPVFYKATGAKNTIVKSLLSSMAVSLITLPMMLKIYGEVSVVGVLLNLIVLPTAGGVLVSGFACVGVGFVSIKLACMAALPGRCLLFLYDHIGKMVCRLPYCTWTAGSPTQIQCMIYYVALVLGLLVLYYRTKSSRYLGIIGIIFAVIIIGYHSRNKLEIICMDIGQGDCTLLKLPTGENILVDGGSSNKKNIAMYQIQPCLKNQGISYIDAIMISHTDEDHISGIVEMVELINENLSSIRIGMIILPQWSNKGEEYEEIEDLALKLGIKVAYGMQKTQIELSNVRLDFISPLIGATGEDANEDAMVVKLSYGNFGALFTGDIGADTEKKLLPYLDDIDYLKVAHHGSRYSTCDEFLDVVKPEIASISCSLTNTYGHPSPETVERLKVHKAEIFYTMKNGAIMISTDGDTIEVETKS